VANGLVAVTDAVVCIGDADARSGRFGELPVAVAVAVVPGAAGSSAACCTTRAAGSTALEGFGFFRSAFAGLAVVEPGSMPAPGTGFFSDF
jgi:hypothetical protein